MASPTLGHRFDSELNRLEAEAARRKERAPSVLVGSPLSADEVRTELPVVQATFLTRQMSQSANVAERETKTERERSMAEKGKEEADEECRKEKAKEEKEEREKSHDDGAHWIMSSFGCSPTAGGCCPINTNGDKDIFGRKFSLPVSNEQPRRQHNAHTLLRPETTRGAMHRSTQSTRPRRSISFLSQSRTCTLSTRRGSPSSQGS